MSGFLKIVQTSTSRTLEILTFSVNPLTGDDSFSGVIVNQAQIDSFGTFATVGGVISKLPSLLLHPVYIELSDGDHALTSEMLYELQRFDYGISDHLAYEFGAGMLVIKSASGLLPATNTVEMGVASSTLYSITLDADPGFADDAYQSYFVKIMSGPGAGEIKPIRSHTGAVFQIPPRWVVQPTGTSTATIVKPAARLILGDDYVSFRGKTDMMHALIDPTIVFYGVDVVGSAFGWLEWSGSIVQLYGGARVLNTIIYIYSGGLSLATSVVDAQGLAPGIGIIYANGGFIRSFTTAFSSLIRGNGDGAGVEVAVGTPIGQAPGLFLFRSAVDDCTDGVYVHGPGVYGGVHYVYGTGNDGYGIKITDSAFARIDSHSLDVGFVTGAGGEISLDGSAITYSDVNLDADKFIIGTRNSSISRE